MAASFALGTCHVLDGHSSVACSSAKLHSALRLTPFSSRQTFVRTKSFPSAASVFPRVCFSLRQKKSSSLFVSFAPEATAYGQEDEEIEEGEDEMLQNEEPEEFKIFVGNLSYSIDSAQLAELFQEAGEVNMVEVIYDRATGRSRGFGFVTMATQQGVDEAVERFNGYEFQGRPLRVNAGPPPPRDSRPFRGGERSSNYSDSPYKLFVGNLPWSADQLSLEQLFSDCGSVVEAKIVYDRETGRSRGFGFVTLSSEEEMQQAISSLNGMDLGGRQIRVDAAEARRPRVF